jgi:hypothetical protein
MKFLISATFRVNGAAAENEAGQRRVLDVFAKWAPPTTMTIHQFLSRVDGGGAFMVVETDNPADLIGATSKFAPFIAYEVCPVVDIADAVGAAQEAIAFRESIS